MLISSEPIDPSSSDLLDLRVKLRLEFLDGVRGYAALYVTAYHLLCWNLPLASIPLPIQAVSSLFRFGHSAVSIFIVLSGFSLMLGVLSHPTQKLRGGVLGYLSRRAKRILPPYYAAMILSLLALYIGHQFFPFATASTFAQGFRVETIVSHLLLIHNLDRELAYDINATHWSVATEWQIYFLLPLLFLPLYQKFGAVAMVSMGMVAGIMPAFFTWGKDVYGACPWYVGTFTLGMLGAMWATWIVEHRRVNYKLLITRVFSCSLLITIVSFGISGRGELLEQFPLPVAYVLQSAKDDGIGGLVISLLLALTRLQISGKGSIWIKRMLMFLSGQHAKLFATFSYSLYLTHMIWVSNWSLAIEPNLPLSDTFKWLVRAFVVLPIVIACAYIFYLLFEAPTMHRK